jgi:hypothetical protein
MNLKNVIAAVVAASALGSPATVIAAGAGGITVAPEQRTVAAFTPTAFLDVAAKRGVRGVVGRLVVRNLERRTLTVELDAVDALTASNLGYAYTVSAARRRGHTRWIRLSTRRVALAPGQTTSVPVMVRAPKNAKPGDYLSGISVETVGQRKRPDGEARMAVSSSQRYVVGVQIGIPGRRTPRLEFTRGAVEGFPAGPTFLLTARNSGNVMLRDVHGRISIYRGTRRIAAARVGPGTFVTRTSARLQVLAATERPDAGTTYRMTGRLHYEGRTARFDQEVTFGERQQQTQESYGRASAAKDGGVPLPLAIALALAVVASTALIGGKHRRTRARLARLDVLEQELAARTSAAGGRG